VLIGELRQNAHLYVSRRWINHKVCDTWPVRRQTYGHLPSLRASLSFHHPGVSCLDRNAVILYMQCIVLLQLGKQIVIVINF